MTIDASLIVHSDPAILGGMPVFVGTRVPAEVLFDWLKAGDRLEHFLANFPSVSLEQAQAAIDLARDALLASVRTPR
ncbi:MAG TPA: DUF433 domain-containing protein [Gemmatimonadaceae bacterium]|jgi:uncharacterized protein (DUF433 family)